MDDRSSSYSEVKIYLSYTQQRRENIKNYPER